MSWFQVLLPRLSKVFENAVSNGCNLVRSLHAERHKTKAGVRFEYPAVGLNYPSQHLREKKVECELLRLRR